MYAPIIFKDAILEYMNILITGAGSGIGFDTTQALARKGHHVYAVVKKKSDCKQFESLQNITALQCDIASEADRSKLANISIDVLINNAGIGESGPITYVPLERIKHNFEVNVFGTVALIQLFTPHFVQKKKGRIINVSSVAGKIALPYLGVYNATKFALEAVSDSLRQELKPYGVFVSVIEPGPIATGFNEKMIATKNAWLSKSKASPTEKNRMEKYHNSLISNQYSTESVVAALIDAVESKKPRTRYVAPSKYGLLVKLAVCIPDMLRDFFLKARN